MNNKILSVVLVVGIATTGFAGISAANTGLLGETIEQKVDSIESKFHGGKHHGGFGKRAGQKHLTDEEKTALESMSDDEKKAFFTAKKAEMKAKKEAAKSVIDKLIAGESLTADEEATRLEMIAKMAEHEGKHKKPGAEVIAKVLAGDELSVDEQAQLAEMKAKHEEREAQREILAPIMEKKKAGEDLTDEEQAILDEMKANKPEGKRKGHGKKGGHKKGPRGEK